MNGITTAGRILLVGTISAAVLGFAPTWPRRPTRRASRREH